MADIFISYSQADRPWVEKLARLIEGQGFSVWWDVKVLPGDEFGDLVTKEIGTSKCVLVVWSKHSVNSDWVYGEADEARRTKKLVPVLKDAVSLPTAFRKIHAADLSQWDYQRQSPEFAILLDAIRSRVKQTIGAKDDQSPVAATDLPAPPGHAPQIPPADRPDNHAFPSYPTPDTAHEQPQAVTFKGAISGLFDRLGRMNKITLRLISVATIILILVKYSAWLPASAQNLTFWSLYWMLSEWTYAGIFAVVAFSDKPFSPLAIRLFLWVGALTSVLQIGWVFISVEMPTPALGLYCIAYIATFALFGAMAFTGSASLAERLKPFTLIAVAYYALLDMSHISIAGGAESVDVAYSAVAMHALEVIVVCMAPPHFAGKA
jgi:TIR domain